MTTHAKHGFTLLQTFNLTSKHAMFDSQLLVEQFFCIMFCRLDATDCIIDGNFGNVSVAV